MMPRHRLRCFLDQALLMKCFWLAGGPVAAGRDRATKTIQDAFDGSNLRIYRNTDLVGVALAGAMKNVIAIAAGCCRTWPWR